MRTDLDPEDWTPEPVNLTLKDWIIVGLLVLLIFVELKYMWVWCQWFTACPTS